MIKIFGFIVLCNGEVRDTQSMVGVRGSVGMSRAGVSGEVGDNFSGHYVPRVLTGLFTVQTLRKGLLVA